jgi:glycosyltransferase involved in cell wall biosynthesis
LKVVVGHNRYQSGAPSGENRIVDTEIALLRSAGVDVVPFIEESDELTGAQLPLLLTAAAGPVRSPRGVKRFRKLVAEHQPDVLHLHNVFPLISPWVIRTAVEAGVPVVQTVHNYRHTCVAGTHLREGRVCEDCRLHSLPWPAIQHACYRGSRAQSALMALGQVVHRPTWRLVSRFLAASPHMEERLVSIGVPPDRIEWRPTFAEDVGATPMPTGGGIAFVGRLEQAKGVDLLLRAWTSAVAERWGRLVIAGDGPLSERVAAKAADDPSIEWRGSLDAEGVRAVMRESRVVALPSLWFEGFPRVAAEAMSVGRPLLLCSVAGFSQLADSGAGWALDSDPESWTRRLLDLDDASLAAASAASREFYERHCSPEVGVEQLRHTYLTVMAERVSK